MRVREVASAFVVVFASLGLCHYPFQHLQIGFSSILHLRVLVAQSSATHDIVAATLYRDTIL